MCSEFRFVVFAIVMPSLCCAFIIVVDGMICGRWLLAFRVLNVDISSVKRLFGI